MPRFPIASRDTVPQDQVDTFGVIAIRLMRDMLSRATLPFQCQPQPEMGSRRNEHATYSR